MNTTELTDRVTSVIDAAGDYEKAHSMEDRLMKEFIREHASPVAIREFNRMWEAADFPRHYA